MLNKIFHKIIKYFIFLIKFLPNLLRNKLRYFVFDYREQISDFSEQKIFLQKKELTNKINEKNFLMLTNFIESKKIYYLNGLFANLKKSNSKKINYIFIYSYLVNIHEFRLANVYHEKLCDIISKKQFFYFQICKLNEKNIAKFRLFSRTLKFKLIYLLLYSDEKNFIKTILNIKSGLKCADYTNDQKDKKFEQYLRNKKVNIIGPLDKKINLNKKELKNSIIIRFKNTNYLNKKDYYPQVTFLNGRASRKYFENKNYLSNDKGLIWIVYINKTFYKKFSRNSNVKKRYAVNTGAFLFTCFTELNFLQKVLLDLILFNPKQIKIHNFNMYLSKRTRIGYGVNNTLKKQMNSNITFNHNQIVQFEFINFLYKKNFFLLDENLKKIINNGKNSYLKKLENTWKK